MAWKKDGLSQINLHPKNLFTLSKKMVGAAGFEPATFCTPCNCATELRHAPMTVQFESFPLGKTGLIIRPSQNSFLVGVRGFEPPTPWSRTKCASRCATPRPENHSPQRDG